MRFAVLHHRAWPGKQDHYDLLIQFHEGTENDRFLKAFASLANAFPFPSPPGELRRESRLQREEDHRIAYLTYEGPVGGGRGRVTRVDEGECKVLRPPTREELLCRLTGVRLRGTYRVRHLGQDWVIEEVMETNASEGR